METEMHKQQKRRSLKHAVLLLCILPLLFCHEPGSRIVWSEGFPEDFSIDDKIILVDFYSEACVPCERLKNETFADLHVVEFCHQNFRCFRLNNWAQENKSIQESNRVYEIPTLIFFNNRGEEIERLTGFIPPERMMDELWRIKQGKDTYLALKHQFMEDTLNQELIYQLAVREARIGRKGDKPSEALWKRLAEVSEPGSFHHDLALLNYYTGILWRDEKPDLLIHLLDHIDDYEFKLDGCKSVIDFYQYKQQKTQELKYFRQYVNDLYRHRDPYDQKKLLKFFISYAFRAAETEPDPESTLLKIDSVFSDVSNALTPYEKADVYYIKAGLFRKMGQYKKAIAHLDTCIDLLPPADRNHSVEKRAEIEKEMLQ